MSTDTAGVYAENLREIEKLHSRDVAATLSGDQAALSAGWTDDIGDTRTRRGAWTGQAGDSRRQRAPQCGDAGISSGHLYS